MSGSRRLFSADEAARFAEAGASHAGRKPSWPTPAQMFDIRPADRERITNYDLPPITRTDVGDGFAIYSDPITATEIEWDRANPPKMTPEQRDKAEAAGEVVLGPLIATANRMLRKMARALTPIPWGKPDLDLALAVRDSILKATPATIIPWRPGQAGLAELLRSRHIHTAIDDENATHTHNTYHWTPDHD